MAYTFNTIQFEATEVRAMPFTHDHASFGKQELGSFEHVVEESEMRTFNLHPRSHLPVCSFHISTINFLLPHNVLLTKTQDGKMPGIRCPRCAARGIETWVLSGKHCPKCNHPC